MEKDNKLKNNMENRTKFGEFDQLPAFKLAGASIAKQDTKLAEELLKKIAKDRRRKEAHILTPEIASIYVSEANKTIVIKWKTGEVTKVTAMEGDKFDLEHGITMAITKYVLGNNYNAGTILKKYIASVKKTDKPTKITKSKK